VSIIVAALWFQCVLLLSSAQYTTECITRTKEVFMPDPVNGKCYCGATWIEPRGGYAEGYCVPYPRDEGMRDISGCKPGRDMEIGDVDTGKCEYWCTCLEAKMNRGPVTCCKVEQRDPLAAIALSNGVIYRAPAPPPPTYPPSWLAFEHTTRTARMLTTVTTTAEPYFGAQKLVGNIEFSTVLPWKATMKVFLEDLDVIDGIVHGISIKLGIPLDWITASLSMPTQAMRVDYVIDVPDQREESPEIQGNQSAIVVLYSFAMYDNEEGLLAWGETIGTALTKKTSQEYWVAVHSASLPKLVRLDGPATISHAFGATPSRNLVLFSIAPILLTSLLWSPLPQAH